MYRFHALDNARGTVLLTDQSGFMLSTCDKLRQSLKMLWRMLPYSVIQHDWIADRFHHLIIGMKLLKRGVHTGAQKPNTLQSLILFTTARNMLYVEIPLMSSVN